MHINKLHIYSIYNSAVHNRVKEKFDQTEKKKSWEKWKKSFISCRNDMYAWLPEEINYKEFLDFVYNRQKNILRSDIK